MTTKNKRRFHWRTLNWRGIVLVVAILVSIVLSGLVWVEPYRLDRLTTTSSSKTTTTLQSQADVFTPTTAIKTNANRSQVRLINQPKNVVLTAKEALTRWTIKEGKVVSKNDASTYRDYLRYTNSLLLSYPAAISVTAFNSALSQKVSTKQLILVNHILIPLKSTGTIYLLQDQGQRVVRYRVSHQSLKKLKAAMRGGQRLPVDVRLLNNRPVLVYSRAIKLPSYSAKVAKQDLTTLASALLSSNSRSTLAVRTEGNQTIYHNGSDQRLAADQTTGAITVKNYQDESTNLGVQKGYSHFYHRLTDTHLIKEQLYFDGYNHRQQRITFRTYVAGFPVMNNDNYGTVIIQQGTKAETLHLSLFNLSTPLPTKAGATTLPATSVVFNTLQATGKLKDVKGLRIGYRWESNTEASTVTLKPAYYAYYNGSWVAVDDLVKEGSH